MRYTTTALVAPLGLVLLDWWLRGALDPTLVVLGVVGLITRALHTALAASILHSLPRGLDDEGAGPLAVPDHVTAPKRSERRGNAV